MLGTESTESIGWLLVQISKYNKVSQLPIHPTVRAAHNNQEMFNV